MLKGVNENQAENIIMKKKTRAITQQRVFNELLHQVSKIVELD